MSYKHFTLHFTFIGIRSEEKNFFSGRFATSSTSVWTAIPTRSHVLVVSSLTLSRVSVRTVIKRTGDHINHEVKVLSNGQFWAHIFHRHHSLFQFQSRNDAAGIIHTCNNQSGVQIIITGSAINNHG